MDLSLNEDDTIHCDGSPGYDALAARSAQITLSGCMVHVRRKFVKITKMIQAKEGVAHTVVNFIAKLAHIESDIKENSPENKKIIRQEKAKSILEELHAILQKCNREPFRKVLSAKPFLTH